MQIKIAILRLLLITIFAGCLEVPAPTKYEPIPEDTAWKLERRFSESTAPVRIAVVSHYTTDAGNLPFIKLATENHAEFAKKHKYDYFFRNGTIPGTEKFFLPEGKNRILQLGLYWQKIQATWDLLQLKKDNKYVYDYVFWIDTDVLFTNMDQLLEKFIENSDKNTYLFIAEDVLSHSTIQHTCINAGVFMVKNSEEGRDFINDVMRSFKIYSEVWVPEQAAMQDLAYGFLDPIDIEKIEKDETALAKLRMETKKRVCTTLPKKGVEVYSMREFNAGYPWDFENVGWGPSSFTAHFFTLNGILTGKYMEPLLDCLKKNDFKNRERCSAKNLNIALTDFDYRQ